MTWGLSRVVGPTPVPELDVTAVTPGVAGFLAIFAVALASIGLFFGLTRQLRRMRHNAQVRDEALAADLDGEFSSPDATQVDAGPTDRADAEVHP